MNEQKVWMLLEIVRLSAGHPQLRNIKDEALLQLNEINSNLSPPINQANLVAQAASVDNGDSARNEEPLITPPEEQPSESTPEVERRA